MTFKWKITTPARVTRVEGVEMCIPGIDCDFETGSGSEAVGVFEAEDAAFTKIFGFSPLARVDFSGAVWGAPKAFDAIESGEYADLPALGDSKRPDGAVPAPAAPKKRSPKPKVEAVAPDPIPVPPVDPITAPAAVTGPAAAAPSSAPPPVVASPPIAAEPGPNGIPAFLDRTAAAAPPPPPALPPLPAAAPAAAPPPVGVLGPKVVKALDERKKLGSDGGQALADWLAATGLTIKGASYDDACRAVLMISDDKITAAGIPAALGVA